MWQKLRVFACLLFPLFLPPNLSLNKSKALLLQDFKTEFELFVHLERRVLWLVTVSKVYKLSSPFQSRKQTFLTRSFGAQLSTFDCYGISCISHSLHAKQG